MLPFIRIGRFPTPIGKMELPHNAYAGNDLYVIPGAFCKYAFRNGTQAVPYSYSLLIVQLRGRPIHFETAPFFLYNPLFFKSLTNST